MPMPKHVRYDRLHEMHTTATEEFERLLRGTVDQLWHLPYQHRATIEQAIHEAGLDLVADTAGRGFEIGIFGSPYGAFTYDARISWINFEDQEAQHSSETVAALKLLHLLLWIEKNAHKAAIETTPVLAMIHIKQEFMRHFWTAFVIPEIHAEGVTLKQSERRSRTNSHPGEHDTTVTADVRAVALQLLRKGMERARARDELMSRYNINKRRAYQILEEVWGPAITRKK